MGREIAGDRDAGFDGANVTVATSAMPSTTDAVRRGPPAVPPAGAAPWPVPLAVSGPRRRTRGRSQRRGARKARAR